MHHIAQAQLEAARRRFLLSNAGYCVVQHVLGT
jgi:hypothetical protein